jgi:SAM-dependent methyltransferase
VKAKYDQEFYTRFLPVVTSSAEVVAPIMIESVAPSSVLDVGCGSGAWLEAFARRGVVDVFGVDFSAARPAASLIGAERLREADLNEPLRLQRRFDLALCLEVAEHLPQRAADTLVESLVAHAPVVLFSAAIPFQGGTGHQNEQWPNYWVKKFQHHGFHVCDFVRERVWSDQRVAWWYAQNLLLFANEEALGANRILRSEVARTGGKVRSLVHPVLYLQKADRPSMWQRFCQKLGSSGSAPRPAAVERMKRGETNENG